LIEAYTPMAISAALTRIAGPCQRLDHDDQDAGVDRGVSSASSSEWRDLDRASARGEAVAESSGAAARPPMFGAVTAAPEAPPEACWVACSRATEISHGFGVAAESQAPNGDSIHRRFGYRLVDGRNFSNRGREKCAAPRRDCHARPRAIAFSGISHR